MSGATAYNFYFPSKGRDAIFLGVYDDGRVWSDLKALGADAARRLAAQLVLIGIVLDTSKEWQFWRKGGQLFDLHNEDPLEIATCVLSALRSGNSDD